MIFYPREYQSVAIKRMVDNPTQLLALRMGAGKTVVTLLAIKQLKPKKTLVVAPKRVTELVWHSEAAKWEQTSDLKVQRVLGNATARKKALSTDADIYVINRENFSWLVDEFPSWPFECVVIDENRGFKDRSSKSWQSLKRVRNQIKRLYILTGTPAPNTLQELWPQISILDRGERLGRSLTAFRDKWFVPDKRNGNVIYTWALKENAESEIHQAVSDIMLTIQSDIVLPDRIDNVVPVCFDMTTYREMKKEMVVDEIVAVSAGVLAMKLAQMANGAVYNSEREVRLIHDAKLDALEEIIEQGEPVLCLTSYQHDQLRILRRFPKAQVFNGEDSLKAWQSGRIELLLMHPASGGHGVDGLQLGGNVIVWFGLPFSLDLYEQANARLHRTGQRKSVVVHHLVAVNTIDEQIMKALADKGDMQQALLDAVKQEFIERVV